MSILVTVLALVVVHALCGYMAYGITLSMFWNEFPSLQKLPGRGDELRRRATRTAILGISGLIAALLVFGWRYSLNPMWHLPDESVE
jgi:hypothetical protein